jgi:hypothetical protein
MSLKRLKPVRVRRSSEIDPAEGSDEQSFSVTGCGEVRADSPARPIVESFAARKGEVGALTGSTVFTGSAVPQVGRPHISIHVEWPAGLWDLGWERHSNNVGNVGVSTRFKAIDRETAYLLPPSVQDWLPEPHVTRFVVHVVSKLPNRGPNRCGTALQVSSVVSAGGDVL